MRGGHRLAQSEETRASASPPGAVPSGATGGDTEEEASQTPSLQFPWLQRAPRPGVGLGFNRPPLVGHEKCFQRESVEILAWLAVGLPMWCIRGSRKFCSFPGLGLKHTPPSPLPRSLHLPLQRKVSGTINCKDTAEEDKGHGWPGAGVLPGEQRGHGTLTAGLTCPACLSSFSVIVRLSAPGGAASEGLPRRCRLGLAVGVLEARKPKTLQQVSAVWTRPGLTGWLGPVLRDTRSGPPSEVWLFP